MIAERLKILLKELKLSQRQFAIKINLDAGYFSRIIQGKVNPPDRILLLIENVFNVNKDWLENGQGEMFCDKGIPLAKKQALEIIDTFNNEQVKAVLAFINSLDELEKTFPSVKNGVNNNKRHQEELFNIFDKLSPELQDYLLKTAKDLLETQHKMRTNDNITNTVDNPLETTPAEPIDKKSYDELSKEEKAKLFYEELDLEEKAMEKSEVSQKNALKSS